MPTIIPVSDLTFELSGCPRCFWVKYRESYVDTQKPKKKPRGVFPSVFNTIDKHHRNYWEQFLASDVDPSLPAIALQGKKVKFKSVAIGVGNDVEVILSGEMDLYATNGVEAVILDGKTTGTLTPEKALGYAPQLLGYKYCMEHPAKGEAWPVVKHLGLVSLEPGPILDRNLMSIQQNYIPVPLDGFDQVLHRLGELLGGPKPAMPEKCEWCRYREMGYLAG